MNYFILFIIGAPLTIFFGYMLLKAKGILSILFFVLTVVSGVLCFPFISNIGKSKKEESPKNNFYGETFEKLNIDGNTATFTHTVEFMYTIEDCSIGEQIWALVKTYPNISEINITLIETCKDKYGNVHTTQSKLKIDQGWINQQEVMKYSTKDAFCNHVHDNGAFLAQWVPKGNYCN
jgi:hypothetical protein